MVELGITLPSGPRYIVGVALPGAFSRKSITTGSAMSTILMIIKPPPPMPLAFASSTPSAKPVAIAASTALPPFLRISIPTWDASGLAAATTPFSPTAARPYKLTGNWAEIVAIAAINNISARIDFFICASFHSSLIVFSNF